MKAAGFGVLFLVGVVSAHWFGSERSWAQPAASPSAELMAFSTPLGDGRQQVTIIDPRMRTMGVYHTDASTGEITLRSVRNISWDLQLTEFNSDNPLPREVQTLVEQR